MPNQGRDLGRRPRWTITSYQDNQMNTLTVDPDSDGGLVAVFSFEEEAETYLGLLGDEEKRGWCSRETTAGELISLLLAPCTRVRGVALDPLPLSYGRVMLPLVRVERDRFVQYLMWEAEG
jgi:hypothetical protein